MVTLTIYKTNGDIIQESESSFENAAADLYNHYILDENLEDEIKEIVIG